MEIDNLFAIIFRLGIMVVVYLLFCTLQNCFGSDWTTCYARIRKTNSP